MVGPVKSLSPVLIVLDGQASVEGNRQLLEALLALRGVCLEGMPLN